MPKIPSEEEVLGYMETLSNWGRWGPDDHLGTLNLLTPEKTAKAASLVREGRTVGCARPILFESAPDVRIQPIRFMTASGEDADHPGGSSSSDWFGMAYHGVSVTHVDSIGHMFWNGKMYNGRPAGLITTREGATAGNIEILKKGVAGRGVLLDVTRVLGVDWMQPGQGYMPEELEAAEKAQGVQVEEGDILFVRTGKYKRRLTIGPTADGGPGAHAAVMPWLHKRGVALLGSDVPTDPFPLFSHYPKIGLPLHHIGMPAMGLWLLDNANLEELVQTCLELNRWEFFLVIGPLRLDKMTGSPLNPIAIF